ncbi:MAG TPA: hypothetical protein VHF06_26530 [Pseudonocardiaceae bacterium]|nr:hypothetical protein [Pseudonocardiaceae bacterium]
MTGSGDQQQPWGQQPGPQYNQQPYYPPPYQPQPYYPPGQGQYPPPYQPQPYQPQPYQPQPYQPPGQAAYPHQAYPQQPQYGPASQAAGQPTYGPPIVIPVEGKGAAKLAAKLNKRSLIVSPEGFAHEGKQGAFRIAWGELRRITITTAYHQNKTQLLAPKVWRVRVVMDTADPSFPQRHPEISGLQGKYGGTGPGSYGLPLGPVPNLVATIAQALATYGGAVFGGVIEEGQVLGFSYL